MRRARPPVELVSMLYVSKVVRRFLESVAGGRKLGGFCDQNMRSSRATWR
jgi:hypothetical protein